MTTQVPVTTTPGGPSAVLSQDFISSNNVMVTAERAQIAPFCNPYKGGLPEAAVLLPEGNTGNLMYLQQDSTEPNGWSLLPLPPGGQGGPTYQAVEVVAVVNWAGGGVNLFWNDGTELMQSWLTGDTGAGTWTMPTIAAGDTVVTNLSVTYALGTDNTPSTDPWEPVVWGIVDDGGATNLFMFIYNNGWSQVQVPVSGGVFSEGSGMSLVCLQNNGDPSVVNWVLMAEGTASPTGPAAWTGTVNVGGSSTPATGPTAYPQTRTTFGSIFGGVPVLPEPGAFPLYLDSSGMPFMSSPIVDYWDQILPAPTSSLGNAWATTTENGLLSLFLLEPDANLALMHQVAVENSNNVPLWAPYTPIAAGSGITYVFVDTIPTDPFACFVTQGGDGDVLLLQLMAGNAAADPPIQPRWVVSPCALSTDQQYEVSRYITSVPLFDENGAPVPNYPVNVTATASVGVQVGAQSFVIGPDGIVWDSTTAGITTDSTGTITLAVMATDLAPPTFTISDSASPANFDPIVVSPGANVQNYLNGATNPLPPTSQTQQQPASQGANFTSSTLTGATATDNSVNPPTTTQVFPGANSSNASDAASNIQSVIGIPSNPGPLQPGPYGGPPIAGFILNNMGADGPVFQTFTSRDDLHAELLAQGRYVDFSIGHDISHAFSDVWSGITSGAAKVAHIAVDAEKAVVSLVVEIGGVLQEIGNFIIQTIEDALNVVFAILAALEAVFEILLLLLKALFDFGQIWNTMTTLYGAVTDGQLTTFLGNEIAALQADVTTILNNLETNVVSWFDKAESTFSGGNNTFGGQSTQYGQSVGSPPTSTSIGAPPTPTGTPVSTANVTANPQGNWYQSQVSAGAGNATIPKINTEGAVADALEKLLGTLETAAATELGEFTTFIDDLWESLKNAIDGNGGQAADFAELAVDELLQMIQTFVVTAINLAGDIATDILSLGAAVVAELDDWLTQPIRHGFLSSLWDFLHKLAGSPPDPPPFNVASFLSLLVAFPYTVTWWFINGFNAPEPFPGGTLPTAPAPEGGDGQLYPGGGDGETSGGSLACQMVGPIGQIMYVAVDAIGDVSSDTPAWLATFEVVGPLFISTFSWPSESGIPFTAVEAGDAAAGLELAAWGLGFVPPLLSAVFLAAAHVEDDPAEQLELYNALKVLNSFFGTAAMVVAACAFGAALIEGTDGSASYEDAVAGIITPFSNAFAWLTLPSVEDGSDGLALPLKLIVDFVGDVVGGAIELVGVMVND